MKNTNKKENRVILLLKWAGKEKKWLIISSFCAFLSGIFAVSYYFGLYHILLEVLSNTGTIENIKKYVYFIFVGTALRLVCLGTSGVLSHKGAYRCLFQVRCKVMEHIAKIPLGSLDERGIGAIKTVLNEDIEKLELFLAHNLPELIAYMTTPVVVFIYLCTVNIVLALLSLVPLVIGAFIMKKVFATMIGLMDKASKAAIKFNSVMIEYITGMRLVKAYRLGSRSFHKFINAVETSNQMWKEITYKTAPLYSLFQIVIEGGMIFMIPIGGIMYKKGMVNSGVLLLFIFVGSLYLGEILPLQQLGATFAQAMNGVSKTKELLDIPILEGKGAFPKNYDIELQNVTFSYNVKDNVLSNCNLKISKNKKIALIGASGSGKSTIVQLISRFYDVGQGTIKIGGKDIRDIAYDELLKNISIVFQKTFLTRDSVFENIRLGTKASLENVREAAKKAQIDDFIMSLPEQYDTKVGSFGSRFSGGERQRIAIARAILKDAKILLLDEATSAADPENQAEIDEAITNLCQGKTVIIVAHRLSAVQMCDKIAVVENKRVSAYGTHEELLEKNAYYKHAWTMYEESRNTDNMEKEVI